MTHFNIHSTCDTIIFALVRHSHRLDHPLGLSLNAELGKAFSLPAALLHGTIPVVASPNPEATLHPPDLRGLKTFGEDYPQAERILVYRGTERLLVDGIRVVPCEEFLPEFK